MLVCNLIYKLFGNSCEVEENFFILSIPYFFDCQSQNHQMKKSKKVGNE